MHTFILQDWTTIQGASTLSTINQGETAWLDLTPYQDVVFWVDCREVGGTAVTMSLQTSPDKDEVLFMPMVAPFALTSASTPAIKPALMAAATSLYPPIARFLRWQLIGSGSPWAATFRVLVAANSPGT